MDTGAWNQHADEPEEKGDNEAVKGSYSPQFTVTGQKLQYHQASDI